MCFGSFTESSVKITSPREGEHIPYANLIRVEYDITNFGIRVDGGMCMKASGDVDNATQICAYQPGAPLYINASIAPESIRNSWNVHMSLEILSNVYSKSISRHEIDFVVSRVSSQSRDPPSASKQGYRPVIARQIVLT